MVDYTGYALTDYGLGGARRCLSGLPHDQPHAPPRICREVGSLGQRKIHNLRLAG
jgi:hypothetical protein